MHIRRKTATAAKYGVQRFTIRIWLVSLYAGWIRTSISACTALHLSHADFLAEIKAWYDGYRFEEDAESVYNPVSLARFFEQGGKFKNYWFETGTPSFLMELVKKTRFNFDDVLSKPVSSMAFNAFEIDKIDPLTLLLQTGYLTIKSMVKKIQYVVVLAGFSEPGSQFLF